MTAPKKAKAAALEALIEAHAIELKLPTVRRGFRALAQEATREQQTAVAYRGGASYRGGGVKRQRQFPDPYIQPDLSASSGLPPVGRAGRRDRDRGGLRPG